MFSRFRALMDMTYLLLLERDNKYSNIPLLLLNKCLRDSMVNCLNCGKELAKPEKKIENSFFCLAVYKCDVCGISFKVAY